jgi:hypothetical protein
VSSNFRSTSAAAANPVASAVGLLAAAASYSETSDWLRA